MKVIRGGGMQDEKAANLCDSPRISSLCFSWQPTSSRRLTDLDLPPALPLRRARPV